MTVDWQAAMGRAGELIRGYNAQGIRPTLRQVHYRLASEQVGGHQNTQACYKGLGGRFVKARMESLISWDSLVDHFRYRWWNRPSGGQIPSIDELVERAAEGLGEDPWDDLGKRVVVWLEKDSLAELVYDAVGGYYVPLAVSRGYSSWTFIHDNLGVLDSDAEVKALGDRDPSGLDIGRSTEEAVEYFSVDFELERVALTSVQVQRINLLPNFTKKADPRAREYIAKYGDECWELDALEPRLLRSIVEDAVRREIDPKIWNEVMDRNEKAGRGRERS